MLGPSCQRLVAAEPCPATNEGPEAKRCTNRTLARSTPAAPSPPHFTCTVSLHGRQWYPLLWTRKGRLPDLAYFILGKAESELWCLSQQSVLLLLTEMASWHIATQVPVATLSMVLTTITTVELTDGWSRVAGSSLQARAQWWIKIPWVVVIWK